MRQWLAQFYVWPVLVLYRGESWTLNFGSSLTTGSEGNMRALWRISNIQKLQFLLVVNAKHPTTTLHVSIKVNSTCLTLQRQRSFAFWAAAWLTSMLFVTSDQMMKCFQRNNCFEESGHDFPFCRELRLLSYSTLYPQPFLPKYYVMESLYQSKALFVTETLSKQATRRTARHSPFHNRKPQLGWFQHRLQFAAIVLLDLNIKQYKIANTLYVL